VSNNDEEKAAVENFKKQVKTDPPSKDPMLYDHLSE
jgi:hypothetical protein